MLYICIFSVSLLGGVKSLFTESVHKGGPPPPPFTERRQVSKKLLSTHSYPFKPGMLLPWVDSRGALTGCGLKKLIVAVLENHRWQNISGSSPQFCSQPGWPQEAQSTRDINLTSALPLHHFQSKVFKLEK